MADNTSLLGKHALSIVRVAQFLASLVWHSDNVSLEMGSDRGCAVVLLERLATILGVYGTHPAGPRIPVHTVVRSVAVHDPAGGRPETGDILLALGERDPVRAVELAGAADASAVVVRTGETDPGEDALQAAQERGVVLLWVPPGVSWSQVAGIVFGMVLEGGETESGRGPSDMPTLADTLATQLGGPVTIEDPRSRVLAYSARQASTDRARLDTILGRGVPEELHEYLSRIGVFDRLASSDDPVYVPPVEEYGMGARTAMAVRVGREFLGSVWLSCAGPLSPERARILAEGTRTVALHLLRSRVSADLERQVESELVGRLLEGGTDPTEAAIRLGLTASPYRVVALQAHTPEERHAAALLAFERATTGFGWSRPGRSTVFGSTVYTVLPCGPDSSRARDWLAETARGLPEHVMVHAGIGGPADPARLAESRREADESLALQSARPHRNVVAYDESWDEILLHRLRTSSASGRRPADGPIADLERHDTEHGTRFMPTLQAWLRAQGDPAKAARMLQVHSNTVRNRMHRMAGVTTLDLEDPDRRLALEIALEVHLPRG